MCLSLSSPSVLTSCFVQAIILFECGKHDDAILRVGDLVDISDDPLLYVTVRVRTRRNMGLYTSLTERRQAQLYLILGSMLMKGGDNKRAIELFEHAQAVIPFQQTPHLVVISLVGIFSWVPKQSR